MSAFTALRDAGLLHEQGDDYAGHCPACDGGLTAALIGNGDPPRVICASGCDEASMLAALDTASPSEARADAQTPTLTPDLLLAEIERFVSRYVVLPGEHEAAALAMWVAHTWAFDAAHATPYLLVVSPEKRAGKTRLIEVIGLLVREPWHVVGGSESALFRRIEDRCPTIMLDEIDAVFGAMTERTEPLRAVLNAGNRPGATIPRTVPVGNGHDVRDFSVWCPKLLAGIDTGRLPDTIRDRGVTLRMKRRTDAERVERFRHRKADEHAQPIREALRTWADGATDALRELEPELPAELDDRAAEAWEPLFAIADVAGSEWPERARRASRALSGAGDQEDPSHGIVVLMKLRDLFGEKDGFNVATADLLFALNEDVELPFGDWHHGTGIAARDVAKLLRPFGPRPRKVWIDTRALQGYRIEDCQDALTRYLPPTCQETEEAEEAEGGSNPEDETAHEYGGLPDLPYLPDSAGSGRATRDAEAISAPLTLDEIDALGAEIIERRRNGGRP